ncbi:MAG: helix-turn-helix transcriptional regulator [Acidimicrobiia bacterium]
MARRKPGTLLPLELAILDAATAAARDGEPDFHGFAVAQRIRERDGARRLTAHGTLYKALARMETAGLLESRWEDPDLAVADGRPRRRLYRVTPLGAAALVRARAEAAATEAAPGLQPGMVT